MSPFINHILLGLCLYSATSLLATAEGLPKLALTQKIRAGTLEQHKRSTQARADLLHLRARGETSSSIEGSAIQAMNSLVTMSAIVKFGETDHVLSVDTGSGPTIIGAYNSYVPSSSSNTTSGKYLCLTYGTGAANATIHTDLVALSPELTIPSQAFGVVENATSVIASGIGFVGAQDGILGLGTGNLTTYVTVCYANGTYLSEGFPMVLDGLYNQGDITEKSIGFHFPPGNGVNGTLTFGGYDAEPGVDVGPLITLEPAKTFPATEFFAVRFDNMTYGGTSIAETLDCIIDTGTTAEYFASDVFANYIDLAAKDGVYYNETVGNYAISRTNFTRLQPLELYSGGEKISLVGDSFVYSREQFNASYGIDDPDNLYVNLGSFSAPSTEYDGKIHCLFGLFGLQRFGVKLTIVETLDGITDGPGKVEFAETVYTNTNINSGIY